MDATMIGSLVKFGFWGGLVLLMLPIDGGGDAPDVSPLQAFLAARETVADLRGICDRRPEVCETGGAALETIKQRAAKGARLALTYIDEQESSVRPVDSPHITDSLTTAAVPQPTVRPAN
jgi:Family of unknown function (DUF5330)